MSSFRGKPVVLYFYPKDDTPGCTTQACEFRDAYDVFRDRGAEVLGVSPDDVDTAQIYDCFTYMVLTQLEDYGFCKKGEGGDFVASGALRMGGRLPTNTSGGQLSEAHVEGVLQVVEGARQMRHTYPAERQVKDAEIALVSGHGCNQVCHSTLILGRA